MDKYEFAMKIDELKRLAANGQFRKAGKVLETIELKKIKNIKEMYVVIDILVENEKYDQAKELLVGISKKIKSRRVIHQLIDVCIKSNQVEAAKKYMKEFHKTAPNDPYNYVFQYQMAQLLEEGYDKQIEILERLKQYEYIEKWAYELAKVYHRAGREADCIAECEDLILWFGEGIYVEKAKLLKQYLTDAVMPSQLVQGQDLQKNNEIRNIFTPFAKQEEVNESQLEEQIAEEEAQAKKEAEDKYEDEINWEDETEKEDATDYSEAFTEESEAVESEAVKSKTVDELALEKADEVDELGGPITEDKESSVEETSRSRHREVQRPLYQSAFDFIEEMELREQEEELDRIIEAANRKKEQQILKENECGEVQEEDRDGLLQDEARGKTQEESEDERIAEEVAEEEHAIANEQEVKQLVNETADLIAEQIESLFFQTEEVSVEGIESGDTIIDAKEAEVEEQVEYEEEVLTETSEEVDRSDASEAIEKAEEAEEQEETKALEEAEELEETKALEEVEEPEETKHPEEERTEDSSEVLAVTDAVEEPKLSEETEDEKQHEAKDECEEQNHFENQQETTDSKEITNSKETTNSQEAAGQHEIETLGDSGQPQTVVGETVVSEAIDIVSETESSESKEAVLEDVDKLIKKRRQRATTKKLNEFIQNRIGIEAEAKEYLGQFAKIHSIGEEILRSLESITDAHNNITIIICGQSTFDETYFARRLAKLFYALKFIQTQKLVVLNQEKFLAIDFDLYIDQIAGGCIVIEEIVESSEHLRNQIQKLHEHGCLVMLEVVSRLPKKEEIEHSTAQEDIRRNRQAPIKGDLQLSGVTETIWLEAFDADELMGFVEEFLEEKEYTIEEDARNYFKNYVEELTRNQDSDIFCKVLEKISKAYHCANQRNKVELRNIAEFGNYQDAAFMSIKCTDFANEN